MGKERNENLCRHERVWAQRMEWIERVFSQKWEKAFVFFKHEEEAKAPQMAIRFRELADSGATKIRTGKTKQEKSG